MHLKGSEENFFLFTYCPKLTFCEEELRVPAELCKDKKKNRVVPISIK